MDKALKGFNETVQIYNMEQMKEDYLDITKNVEMWSTQFKTGEKPEQDEIAYFLTWSIGSRKFLNFVWKENVNFHSYHFRCKQR